MLFTKGGESSLKKGLIFHSSICFWRFMPKGEKVLAQSKRTAPPPIFQTNDFQLVNFTLVSLCVLKGEQVVFFKTRYLKTLLNTKRRIDLGGVLFSQSKSFWNKGREFQILKMLLKILFIYL